MGNGLSKSAGGGADIRRRDETAHDAECGWGAGRRGRSEGQERFGQGADTAAAGGD